MKKVRFICLLFGLFFLFNLDVFASTNTYTRTKDNPLVPDDVVVSQDNINNILNTPSVSSSEKLYDFADLYTSEEEKKLVSRINEYIDNSSIDVAIVTTNDLCGFSIGDYAYNFYDYNDFMSDGVVFVIYMGDSEPSIYMGNSGKKDGKVFSIYTDDIINKMLAYVYKYISAGDYYKATDDYIGALIGYYNENRGGDYRISENGSTVKSIAWVEIIILSFTLTFIVVVILYTRLSNNKKVSSLDVLDECIDKKNLFVKSNANNNV